MTVHIGSIENKQKLYPFQKKQGQNTNSTSKKKMKHLV